MYSGFSKDYIPERGLLERPKDYVKVGVGVTKPIFHKQSQGKKGGPIVAINNQGRVIYSSGGITIMSSHNM